MNQILTGPDEETRDKWEEDVPESSDDSVRRSDSQENNEVNTCMKDIVYSIGANHYYDYPSVRTQYDGSRTLVDILDDDINYFLDEFETLKERLGINNSSVIAVEGYVINQQHGYGGQADLLYEDPDGNVVLADLKTSSGLYHKHRLQSVAYSKAIEDTPLYDIENVHRREIIRINPDKHDVCVHSDTYPEHLNDEYGSVPNVDWYDTQQFLVDDYGNFEYESVEEMWSHFEVLTQQYHQKHD